jgi:hypothetical protein
VARQRHGLPSMVLPAWMLSLSLLPFVAVVATGLIGFMGRLPVGLRFTEITPDIMAMIQTPWVLVNLFVAIAMTNGAAGAAMIAYAARRTREGRWMIGAVGLHGLAVAIAIIGTLLRLSVTTFDEATLGANRSYQWAMTLGYLGTPVLYLATLVLCVGLIASGILRRIGIVVGAISGLLFVVAYVPGVSDGMPPFTIALLWMPIGIGLLLRERRSMAAQAIAPSAA